MLGHKGYHGMVELDAVNFSQKGRSAFKISLSGIYEVTMSISSTPIVAPTLLVSLAATPWLVAIVTLDAAGKLLEQLGLASEEIFRGDRLPVLHLPVSETTAIDE